MKKAINFGKRFHLGRMRDVLRLFRGKRGELEAKALHLHSPLLLYCLPLHFRAAPLSSIAAAVASTALHLPLLISLCIYHQPINQVKEPFVENGTIYIQRDREEEELSRVGPIS